MTVHKINFCDQDFSVELPDTVRVENMVLILSSIDLDTGDTNLHIVHNVAKFTELMGILHQSTILEDEAWKKAQGITE